MFSRLRQLARTRQQVRRIPAIASVLARHGFGYFIHRFGLHRWVPARLSRRPSAQAMPAPRRFRMMLEELGPTAVKFGQMLSTRVDLLPESYVQELRTLTEHAPPFDAAIARRIIETDLKKPIAELFSEFSESPVACGSIGQVHYAVLQTGAPVVVKVKRPDAQKTILADCDLLEYILALADRVEELKPLRLPMMLEEFRKSLERELDLVTEASFTAKIREELAGNPRVRVPAVYWEMTTSNVLVLERLAGVSLNNKAELAALKPDRKRLALDLAQIFLQQYFKSGLFHADPHSGNLLITPEGKIGLVDFGMAGRLTEELRSYLATSFIALVKRDLDIIADIYVEIGVLSPDTDIGRLKADLQEALDKYYGIPIRCLDFQRCFADAMRVARTHRVLLPRDFVLLGKSFITMVMMARELDPDFDLAAAAKPYALSLVAEKLSPSNIGQSLLHELWYLGQSLRRLPRDVRTLSRKLLSGTLQFKLGIGEMDQVVRELDRAANRLAFSLIVSAIVIGSSVLLHAKVPPLMNDMPGWLGRFFATHMPGTSALGLGGFLLAGVLGMLLAIAIWRSGKL